MESISKAPFTLFYLTHLVLSPLSFGIEINQRRSINVLNMIFCRILFLIILYFYFIFKLFNIFEFLLSLSNHLFNES